MADLRIVDAPLLSTVKGTEKLPTGGEGNFSVSVNQVADFAKLKWFLATEGYVDNAVGNVQADLNLHKNNISNPHQVTKEQVGLANVDNTADLDKPVSNATQSAIITANSGKADKSYVDSQDQLKADKNTVEASLLLKADKVDLKASKIASDGGQTQQEINDFGGARWYAKSGGYELGSTVRIENGDTVKNTVANNIINPNVDMTGWVKTNNASQIFDKSGNNQQQVNTILALDFYVEMWGAKGDGVTSDITAFTNAMNDLHAAYKSDGRPRTILIQANKTYVGHFIPLKAGVSIKCPNGMPMFKRSPVPVGTAESVAKWWRIFQVDTASFTTLADISHRIRLENFILDGNMYNSQWTWNTYNQEQASCLFLGGNNTISIGGVTEDWMRARFHLQNIKCQNSVSDGLHVHRNVDLTFSNLEFEHCFRGGLTMTGGNSIIKGNNVTSFDARIDLEVDSSGLNASMKAWIYLKDYWQDVAQVGKERFFTGGCDFGSVNGGVLSLNNVNVLTPPFNMYMAKSDNEVFEKFEILNSIFHSSGENIFRPSNGLFKDTKIILRNDLNAAVCLPFLLAYNNYAQKDQDLIFDGLSVEHYDQNITATKAPIRIESQRSTNLQRLKFINCDFSKLTSATTFACVLGGRLAVDNCNVNTPDIFDLTGTSNSGGNNYPVDLEVGRLIYGPRVTGFAKTALLDTNTNRNVFNFINTEVPASLNIFTIAIGTNGIPKVKKGARIILGDTPPLASTHAFKGDIYRLSNAAIVDGKPYEWMCTTSVGFSRTASTWKPIKWNTAAYITANLPVLTTTDVGSQNIDSTLNKLVTWSGTAWV